MSNAYDEAQRKCRAIVSHPTLARNEKLRLIREIRIRSSRADFFCFRMFMHPNNKSGWFQRDVADHLQQFYVDLRAGLRPKLVIEAPPQHGKSVQIIDFIAWLSGHFPNNKTIYTSFSERLGVRANLAIQRMMGGVEYNQVFPEFSIPARNVAGAQKLRNREIIEFCDAEGYFRNTTVGGSITGESLDLGVIDDPIRGRKDANSTTVRNGVWDWFTDDFFSRFSEDAGLLAILTRWHVDDPIGRMIEKNPRIKVCKYPALAEPGVKLIPTDPREPGSGDALFPEHKTREFILERKEFMSLPNFTALYQQSPYIMGGELIKGEWFQRYSVLPKMKWRAVIADTALKSKQSSDYQVCACFGLGVDGNLYVIDVKREKFDAMYLETKFPDFWNKHKHRDTGKLRWFGIEDKASGIELIQRMRKSIKPAIPVKPIPRSVDKYERSQDFAGYIESGHVYIPENASWVSDFVGEHEAFTADDAHDHDDQVDVMLDAIDLMLTQGNSTIKDML